jgi:hypothetical protein
MPPPNSPQARRTSTKLEKPNSSSSPEKKQPTYDLGKTIGLYDTATVREKVRKWQTSGGGVVTPADAIPAESDKEDKSEKSASSAKAESRTRGKVSSEPKIKIVDPPRIERVDSPATPTIVTAQDEVVVTFEEESENSVPTQLPTPRIVERKPKASRLEAEVREASAPKKRVVSDGHWRRKRSPPKAAAPPSPSKPKVIKIDPGLAWVRPPLLPRKPDEPDPPPKPKPQPKPLKVYSGRPRAKSTNNLRSEEDDSLDRSDDEPTRIRTPTTPQARPSARVARPKTEERTPKVNKSDDEDLPKRNRPTPKRRSSYARALEDPYSSAEDRQRRKNSYTKNDPNSPEENYKFRTSHRRSPSYDDSRDDYKKERRPSRRKSPGPTFSDEEAKMYRRSQRRGKNVDVRGLESDPEPESPPHKLTNNDDEAARRRAMFLKEHPQFTPKETYSAGRKRNRLRKKSYSPEPTPPLVVLQPAGPETPTRAPSNSVEAWLTTTPDPFVEPEGDARKGSKRVFSFEPQSREAFTEASAIETESSFLSELSDPRDKRETPRSSGKQRQSSAKRTTDRNVRAQSEPSTYLDPDDDRAEYSSATSVSTLKRQGARRASHSPTKGRMKSPPVVKSYTESDVASSAVTSSVDPTAFEPPELLARRMFPSTGKRLSTIASVETFNTKPQQSRSVLSEMSEMTTQPVQDVVTALPDMTDPSIVSASRSRTSLKRKLTTHADLISVLSMPASRSKSIVSARSIRTHRSRLETATLEDLMRELASDEIKYMRELRTLADGVIPVLLKCVLSKSEAAVAAGLFKRSSNTEKEAVAEASRAIHDMSVAIQRLKGVHTSIPKESHFQFLIWAQRALSIYEGYVKTWRLGFQDVVVSLAVEGEGSTVSSPKATEVGGAWDQGLPRNEDGYIVDGDGERVDVAFLLKRPLVRLKFLVKTLKVCRQPI